MELLESASVRSKKRAMQKGLCSSCYKNPLFKKTWFCEACYERFKQSGKRNRQKVKEAVFVAYGGYKCSCECGCDVTEPEFLTIDHIGGRKAHGHSKRVRGFHLYYWLQKNNYPFGFRVLCMNCNFALGHAGYCPRAVKKENALSKCA